MNQALQHSAVLQYLRRKYFVSGTTWDVASLKALADTAFSTSTEEVVITSTSSEAAGAASGAVRFDKAILLAAIEELLLEVDPDNTPAPPAAGYVPDFSYRPVQT